VTTDFRPHNILHPVTGLDGLSEGEVLDILGKPRRNPVFNANGLSREEVLNILSGRSRTPVHDANEKENTTMHTGPRYLVYPVEWDDVDIAYILKTAKIIDFGECFDIAKPPEDVGTPGCYRAPELLLERKVGIPSDLWALACTLFEIRTGRKLFEAFFDEDDDNLGDMCDVLGRLPEPWWSTTWEARRQFFKDETDEHGRVVSVHELKTSVHDDSKRDYVIISSGPSEARSLVDKIGHGMMYMEGSFYKDIADEEKPVFADLLGKLLAFTPENRISAQAALEHEWFRI
jgi:serine/threonine protein kinase